eukprot:437901-Heterocapsa_arctica.AAC.1
MSGKTNRISKGCPIINLCDIEFTAQGKMYYDFLLLLNCPCLVLQSWAGWAGWAAWAGPAGWTGRAGQAGWPGWAGWAGKTQPLGLQYVW